MLWGGRWEGGSCLGMHVRIKDFKIKKKKKKKKLNIQKMKIMASGPITSWEIDGETMETVSNFIFLFFKFYSFLFLNFILFLNFTILY